MVPLGTSPTSSRSAGEGCVDAVAVVVARVTARVVARLAGVFEASVKPEPADRRAAAAKLDSTATVDGLASGGKSISGVSSGANVPGDVVGAVAAAPVGRVAASRPAAAPARPGSRPATRC